LVYTLEYSQGLEEMRIAMRVSLAVFLSGVYDTKELEDTSAGSYLRLQAYYCACRKAATPIYYYGTDVTSS
jgi:hypothetical protein